jgi:preprotein translocase subunit YajC
VLRFRARASSWLVTEKLKFNAGLYCAGNLPGGAKMPGLLKLQGGVVQMFISNAYAQAAAGAGGLESSLTSFLPIILMFVVLYFLMIRPQMRRQKEQKTMMEALAKGDEVVTVGGMLGRVIKVADGYVTLEVANGTEVIVQKVAVATLLPKGTIKSL